jgi:hypothetical protein
MQHENTVTSPMDDVSWTTKTFVFTYLTSRICASALPADLQNASKIAYELILLLGSRNLIPAARTFLGVMLSAWAAMKEHENDLCPMTQDSVEILCVEDARRIPRCSSGVLTLEGINFWKQAILKIKRGHRGCG